jgi:hypothetical protein
MNCPQCDQRLQQTVSFCPYCGYDVRNYAAAITAGEENTGFTNTAAPAAETGITHPLYLQIKKYIFYAIAACFLFTLFSVSTIKGGDYSARREEGTEVKVKVSGINLLFGSLPNFTVKEIDGKDVEITNKAKLMADSSPRERSLLRTPWIFRTGYWVLTFGVVMLGLASFVFKEPQHKKYYSLAVCSGLAGTFSVIWIMGDFNRINEKLGMLSYFLGDFHIGAAHSVGMWGLLLCFLFLFVDVVARTFVNTAHKPY